MTHTHTEHTYAFTNTHNTEIVPFMMSVPSLLSKLDF